MTGNVAIFWPLMLQVVLTLAIYPVLMTRRQGAARAAGIVFDRLANGLDESERSRIAGRHLANQYELPVLFYVACLALYATNGASWLAVALAWVFVLSRIVHAAIHLGPNIVPLRGAAFAVGMLTVFALFIMLAVHVAAIEMVVAA